MKILTDRAGNVHLMGIMLLVLALVGAGYLYAGYKENKLAGDAPELLAAYEALLDDSIQDPDDRAKLKQALTIIVGLLYKYNVAGLNFEAVREIERRKMLLQSGDGRKKYQF